MKALSQNRLYIFINLSGAEKHISRLCRTTLSFGVVPFKFSAGATTGCKAQILHITKTEFQMSRLDKI